MIYLIDDKISRQTDYGWDASRFKEYESILIIIQNEKGLKEHFQNIFENDNIIIFHDSFLNSNGEFIKRFKEKLNDNTNVYCCHFSGSYNSRYIQDKVAYLSPKYVYENLQSFLGEFTKGNTNFKILAFGKNADIEKRLDDYLREFKRTEQYIVEETEQNIAFFELGEYNIISPFKSSNLICDWDFFENNIVQDRDLYEIIENYLSSVKYDILYIPLCFGSTLSDYIGLRLAMYIRFSNKCVNQNTPIMLYGPIQGVSDILGNDCFDAIKLPNVKVLPLDYNKIRNSAKSYEIDNIKDFDLNSISVPIPSKYNDNHSIANIWALLRWKDLFYWGEDVPEIILNDLTKTLYFKYIEMKYGVHDIIKNKEKITPNIPNLKEGSRILYIDDEHDKGWANILRKIVENSGAKFIVFDKFEKGIKKEKLIDSIDQFINENDADCYILDLRLHSDDFNNNDTEVISGHKVAEKIKEKNPGNQIVFFTASDEIENLKKGEKAFDAVGYIVKEYPHYNYSKTKTKEIFDDFVRIVREACNRSFLKGLYEKQNEIGTYDKFAKKELDSIVKLLSYNEAYKNIDILNATILMQIVFLHKYLDDNSIKIYSEGKKDNPTKLNLCVKDKEYEILNHLFCTRESINNRKMVIDISDYSIDEISAPDGMTNLVDTEFTLVVAFLCIIMELKHATILKYISAKNIRNTQIAHKGNSGTYPPLTIRDIIDFYYEIIFPVVKKINSLK